MQNTCQAKNHHHHHHHHHRHHHHQNTCQAKNRPRHSNLSGFATNCVVIVMEEIRLFFSLSHLSLIIALSLTNSPFEVTQAVEDTKSDFGNNENDVAEMMLLLMRVLIIQYPHAHPYHPHQRQHHHHLGVHQPRAGKTPPSSSPASCQGSSRLKP